MLNVRVCKSNTNSECTILSTIEHLANLRFMLHENLSMCHDCVSNMPHVYTLKNVLCVTNVDVYDYESIQCFYNN